MLNQPCAIKSTTPMVLVHVHRFHQPTNKTTHAIHPNDINRPRVIHPNEIVGAVPVCPPERPRTGVSIPKIHALCTGYLTMDAPLQGDTGGHTGTAPTHLHHIFPRGVPMPHRIVHSIAHANHAV